MAVTIEWRSDKGVVLICSRVLTGEESLSANLSLLTERSRGMRYAIVDLSEAEEIHVSPAELRATVEEDKHIAQIAEPGMLVVIAAPQDLGFGLARMWEAFVSRDTKWRISVFRSIDDATAWIQKSLTKRE